jgi:hypothetical protein
MTLAYPDSQAPRFAMNTRIKARTPGWSAACDPAPSLRGSEAKK